MDEVSPDVAIIEVVLEQRWDLNFTVCESTKEGLGGYGLTSTEQTSIEQSIKS